MPKYLALLRGINVGGNNVIKMTDLKTCFEQMGFTDVLTYIQSGNVIFESAELNIDKLTIDIETKLSERFSYASNVVLLTQQHLQHIVAEAPEGFGTLPDEYRYDVIFLKPPLAPAEVLAGLKTNPKVDKVTAGEGVLYFSRLSSMSSQSQMTKMIGTPVYKLMTIRNWNTTLKLSQL